MASEAQSASRAALPMLSARIGAKPGEATLACFAFDAVDQVGATGLGLAFLGGELVHELWQSNGELSQGQEGDVHWRRVGQLLYLECVLPDDGLVDPALLAEQAYQQLLAVASAQACPNLLRAWNYMAGINQGEGDQERYRRFCLGRARALESAGIDEPALCAGTAIGGDDPNLRIMLLAGSEAGINIENPRQVSAYHYPRIYGPRSPSFARATALPRSDGQALLMISGTASVVGHKTLHEGDLEAQIEEIRLNLDALLAESARRLNRPGLASFNEQSLVRVYVRHAADWPRIEARMAEIWPGVPLAGLLGDICRADLLLEVEAVLAA
jgi:chorismate lyase / 3-hydroxybenzoate synthase